MTDKQIIIDGVDVSGCDFLAQKDDYCSYSGVTYAYKGQCMCSDEEMCKEHPKCFYKKVLKQLKRKEQECERLKTELDFQKNMYECARADEEDKFEEIIELKQTLAEIKEVAEKTLWTYSNLDDVTKYNMFDKILQKIREVGV